MPTSPLLFLEQHWKYVYILFWLFLSPGVLRALSELSSLQSVKNLKLPLMLKSEK